MMSTKREPVEAVEADLAEALRNFRSSVHAWSDAEFARPRTLALAEHRGSWRMAVVWALGCILAAGSLSAGLYAHEHQQVLARIAAARQVQQRQLAAAKAAQAKAEDVDGPDATAESGTEPAAAQSDAKLMAVVDRDVSQDVPSALEPLAQLMDEGANQ